MYSGILSILMTLEKKLFKTFATELSYGKSLHQNNFLVCNGFVGNDRFNCSPKVLLSVIFFDFVTLVS